MGSTKIYKEHLALKDVAEALVIQPSKYNLDMMLKDIVKKKRHHQILDDEQRGNEEW